MSKSLQHDVLNGKKLSVALFYHSLISDWNHGNAHFLRGVSSELMRRGHHVEVFEPAGAWSVCNLVAEHGPKEIESFRNAYPHLDSQRYDPDNLDLEEWLEDTDLVIVHEWNDHALVKRIGELRKSSDSFRALFHDTHHRSVTDATAMGAYDLSGYDGVLAYGSVIRDIYLDREWVSRAWTWHEAADVERFRPISSDEPKRDLVWIGNWGDEERTAELSEYLLGPVAELGLDAVVHGVRYPKDALSTLADCGIEYRGWLANYRVPETFSRFKVTTHIPRRPYVTALPGIPTIRVFEALACGIPLVCSPWSDAEGLFSPGKDFLVARDRAHMTSILRDLMNDTGMRQELASHGLRTVRSRHTCAHRVNELLDIYREIAVPARRIRRTELEPRIS